MHVRILVTLAACAAVPSLTACSEDDDAGNQAPESDASAGASGGTGAAAGSGGSSGGVGGGGGGSGGVGGEGTTDAGDSGSPRFDVTIADGVVTGTLDGNVRVFRGIPYAAPPLGDNRWLPPQEVQPWTSPRDATAPGAVCPQIGIGTTDVLAGSSEDCLNLNVWMPDPPPSVPLPVMVWIHGGAFVFGSGSEAYYSGSRLVEVGDVIVVTMNYRLGALGFLAHPALTGESATHPTSGNYGILDQQAALRWVRDNIASFGGDPAQVTIFGESAGGFSACAHMVAPESQGLFHRVISESGVCSSPMNLALDDGYANGEALARSVGCTDAGTLLACLRAKTPEELMRAFDGNPAALPGGLFFQGSGALEGGLVQGSNSWLPIVDGDVIPVDVFGVGANVSPVPMLLGANGDEGTLFTSPLLFGGVPVADEAEYLAALERSFGTATAASILAEYPVSAFASANDAMNTVIGDAFFVCSARRTARIVSGAGADVYLYGFTHVAEQPLVPDLGSFHASELSFVFGVDAPLAPVTANEAPLRDAMMGYWTRFAHTGDPNGTTAPAWPTYATASDQSMTLDLPAPVAESGRKASQCDFWDTVVVP